MYLLGYDLGTSSIKAALVAADTGEIIASAQSPDTELSIQAPQPDWAEQDPDVWWEHVQLATQKLWKIVPEAASKIEGIGIAYQMHGLVLIDEVGKVVRPSIIWCDSRAVEIGKEAESELEKEFVYDHLLNMPGNFTASKLKWVKENEAELYEKAVTMMLPGDYIGFKLTDQIVTTASGLSEGILWDFQQNQVSEELLHFYGLSRDLIPAIVPTFGDQGRVSEAAAAALGISAGIPLSYRAGDQPNNALCLNVLQPGEVAATGGTSGVVYGVTDQLKGDRLNRVNSFAHVTHTDEAARVGVLLCINGAGSLYAWLRAQVAEANMDYVAMEQLASQVAIGAEGLQVLPFGNGAERLLQNEPVGAHVMNISLARHHRGHMFRAGLEGIAFAFALGMEAMQEVGIDLSIMRVGNDNLFQSHIFSTTLSTLTGSSIEVLETTGAVGAAIGAGAFTRGAAFMRDALGKTAVVKQYQPNPEWKEEVETAFEQWKRMLGKVRG